MPVELGSHYMAEGWRQELMLFGEFVDRFILPDPATVSVKGYVAQHTLFDQLPALRAGILEPDYCALGESDDVIINAWYGPQGARGMAHWWSRGGGGVNVT